MNRNPQILADAADLRHHSCGSHPIVGEFVRLPSGEEYRIGLVNTNGTYQLVQAGAFFLSRTGGVSASSGSYRIENLRKVSDLSLTRDTQTGGVWFFDQGITGPGRRKDFTLKERVWQSKV